MTDLGHELPFVWPDSRKLADCAGPTPDIDSFLAESQLVLGVVHGLTDVGVARLDKVLTPKGISRRNGDGQAVPSPDKKIRLIVTLYPTCPTKTDTLVGLLQLQSAHSSLEVRLFTCEMLARPENTLAFYRSSETIPTVLVGSAASLESSAHHPSNLTLGFLPEPILAAEWAKWFDVRWLLAARLTERRAIIPNLVLPEGTLEAAQEWKAGCDRRFGRPYAAVVTFPGLTTASSPAAATLAFAPTAIQTAAGALTRRNAPPPSCRPHAPPRSYAPPSRHADALLATGLAHDDTAIAARCGPPHTNSNARTTPPPPMPPVPPPHAAPPPTVPTPRSPTTPPPASVSPTPDAAAVAPRPGPATLPAASTAPPAVAPERPVALPPSAPGPTPTRPPYPRTTPGSLPAAPASVAPWPPPPGSTPLAWPPQSRLPPPRSVSPDVVW